MHACMLVCVALCVISKMECTALMSPQEGRNSHSVMMWVSAVLHACTWHTHTPMWAVPQTVPFKASCDLIKNDSSLVC